LGDERLDRQLEFIIEIDKLKMVMRQSYVMTADRQENSAEHSWHLAMMAMVLAEHAEQQVDLCHALRMVVLHDIVEIDAGDTYCYDEQAARDKAEREDRAATRIFGLLPEDQACELRDLWDEYELQITPESRFAMALDRLMPLLHNYHTEGKSWSEHGITKGQVLAHNACIKASSEKLWQYVRCMLDNAVAKGYLSP
jgi:putative hydrolase of HD superfamily